MKAGGGPLLRFAYRIRGQVQGVGFRPFVYRIAHRADVTGKVLNDAAGVTIHVQGTAAEIADFAKAIAGELPPLARMDEIRRKKLRPVKGERGFVIEPSRGGAGEKRAAITVDSAVCADCLREMHSPTDRRYGHALINCTNCGPRFSIIRDIPYDRPSTTMAAFAMCPRCQAEYDDPADRRFHAQPTCCPECGPKVELVRGRSEFRIQNSELKGDPFATAARLLLAGKIVAIKGLGGFHLAVRADRQAAVARLRRLKRRDAKPFALMCRDMKMVRRLVQLSAGAARELTSPAEPIMLARRRAGAAVAAAVAPGTHRLGVMLPYTPMHHLLWRAMEQQSRKDAELPPLVMTSGNLSSEPLVIDNADATARLGPMCDAILWHNRAIERCVDDSVLLDRGTELGVMPIRRSRGYVPTAWPFPAKAAGGQTGLCMGGELKNTFAVVREGDIILSQHFGDLTNVLSLEHYQKALADLIKLFALRLDFVAHDLHPGYMSTQIARRLAQQHGARLTGVQHHAAHAAAVLAEHAVTGPATVIVCDGTGFGPDGTIWGGELLHLHGASWKRLGRLRPMRLPGGDAAARDPRRSALAFLHQMDPVAFDQSPDARRLFPKLAQRRMLASMLRSGLNSPFTSSTGRLFDAVAALLGVCLTNNHEAEAAMALEAAASTGATGLRSSQTRARIAKCVVAWNAAAELWELDPRPLVASLCRARGIFASRDLSHTFHERLAEGWVDLACAAGAPQVLGASGGVLCNALFSSHLHRFAARRGCRLLLHHLYPPTDAGLAFGQAILTRGFDGGEFSR